MFRQLLTTWKKIRISGLLQITIDIIKQNYIELLKFSWLSIWAIILFWLFFITIITTQLLFDMQSITTFLWISNVWWEASWFWLMFQILIVVFIAILLFSILWFILYSCLLYLTKWMINWEKVDIVSILKKWIKKSWGLWFVSLKVAWMTFLWSLLLIIPWIIYSIYYMFATYVYIEKNDNNWENIWTWWELTESKNIIYWNWWYTFWYVALVWIFFSWVSYIFDFITKDVHMLQNILWLIVWVLWTIFTTIFSYCLYTNLKSEKESVELNNTKKE